MNFCVCREEIKGVTFTKIRTMQDGEMIFSSLLIMSFSWFFRLLVLHLPCNVNLYQQLNLSEIDDGSSE